MARDRRKSKKRIQDAQKRAAENAVPPPKTTMWTFLVRFWKKHWKVLLPIIVSAVFGGGGYALVLNCGNRYYNITLNVHTSPNESDGLQYSATGEKDLDAALTRAIRAAQAISCFPSGKAKDAASILPKFPLLKDIPGLGQVVDDIKVNYEKGDEVTAAAIARSAHALIAPTLDAVSGKSFSIEVAYAKNISLIYCMLAEEQWGEKNYDKALRYMDTAIALWAGHPPGEIVAMRYAILIQLSKTAVSIINDDILRYAQRGGKTFMLEYVTRLKAWGYLQDVAIDMDTHRPCYFYYYSVYGKPSYSANSPYVIKMEWPKVESGPQPYCPFFISQRYIGMGKWESCIFPRPDEEELFKPAMHNRFLLVSTSVVNPETNHGYSNIAVIKSIVRKDGR